MRATGMQFKAAVGNFVCYYVIGLPLGIVLALVVGLKTKGMWIGFSVACGIQVCMHVCACKLQGQEYLFIQTVILFILFVTINWKRQSEMVREVHSIAIVMAII